MDSLYTSTASNSAGVTASTALLTVTPAIPVVNTAYNLTGFALGTTGGGVLPPANPAYAQVYTATDLANALKVGQIGGAALDVFEVEPLPANSPLRDAPNLLLSPHAAWYSDAAISKLQQLVADDIRRALAGQRRRRQC